MRALNAINVLVHTESTTTPSANMDPTLSTIVAITDIVIALLKLFLAVIQLWYIVTQVARAVHRVNDADRA